MSGKHLNIVVRKLCLISVLALVACGNPSDANEKNFSAAMTRYFEQQGDLCLGFTRWPVEVPMSSARFSKDLPSISEQMSALEAAGLVKGEEVNVAPNARAFGMSGKVRRFALTDAAKPFVHAPPADTSGLGRAPDPKSSVICWGHQTLNKVVKWEGPMKFGEFQVTELTYTYALTQLAPWAQREDFLAAFPAVKSTIEAAGKKELRHALKLTNLGWEAKGMK